MIWEDACFWNGHEKRWDDIDPRRFDWWCDECKMAIRGKHVDMDDKRCPNCGDGEELWDMESYIAECQECDGTWSGGRDRLVEDSEGNLIYL